MTANQLRQVLRTYTAHWFFWVAVPTWLLLHASLLSSVSDQVPGDAIRVTLMANLILGLIMGLMLKLQFANPRARLVPGFRAAHLIVAGAMVGAAVAIETVLVLAGEGVVEPLALVSLTLIVIVASAWNFYLMSPVCSFLFAPLMLAVMLAPTLAPRYFAGLIQALNDSPMVSVGMACIGIAAMAALGVRLWVLCEEKPEYSRQMPALWDFTSRAGNRSWRRFEAQAIAHSRTQGWLRDVQFCLVLRGNTAMGPLRRLLFRQLAGGFSSLSMMIGVFVLMLFFLCFLSWWQKPFHAGSVFLLSFLPQHMVFSMLVGIWLRSWPFLARESLWPLGRRDFVHDLARSMACDVAGAAGAHCAAIIVWLKLFPPQGPLSALLLPWLALTMAQYVAAYCLMFWLASFRRFLVLFFGLLGVNGISAALVTAALFAEGGFWSPVSLALAIIVTALAVALLYRLAFRRWCHVDLD